MPTSQTITGKTFEYSGTLDTGVAVFFKPPNRMKIRPEIIAIIRNEISKRSPVRMGANRGPLVADSVGETLAEKYNETPQVMSYILPLLVEQCFCTVSDGKPYVIHLK